MEFVQRHLWWDNSGSYRVLLVLLACMCRAEAQHSDANANECAFNSLGPRLKTLEQTCCTSRHSCARGFPSGRDTCSLACAREFAPFYDKCSNGLARMGLSTPLNSFYTKCLETLYQPGRCAVVAKAAHARTSSAAQNSFSRRAVRSTARAQEAVLCRPHAPSSARWR